MLSFLHWVLRLAFDFLILVSIPLVLLTLWLYNSVLKSLPSLENFDKHLLPSVTKVLAYDGTFIGEFFKEQRYYAKFNEIPDIVVKAFIAAEDANFWQHKGLDFLGILRAFLVNLKEGRIKQGGSTITQQVVKNLVLTREKSLQRKLQEAILAYKIESSLKKEEILELYLNLVFLGNNSYGVKAAAKNYFRKDLRDLTLAEAALLAGLPQAPSKYSPFNNFALAKERQRYVLNQMLKNGWISETELLRAVKEELKLYKANFQNYFFAPYYLAEVRKEAISVLPDRDIDSEGLIIETFLIPDMQISLERSLRQALIELDKKFGYRGPIGKVSEPSEDLSAFKSAFRLAVVKQVDPAKSLAVVDLSGKLRTLNLEDDAWYNNFLTKDRQKIKRPVKSYLQASDVIEVDLKEDELTLAQTPEVAAGGITINPKGGEVLALQGGFSYQVSNFNRVTQSFRQAGSAFKPIVYLAAIDQFGYTPLTILQDEPRSFRVGGTIWSPKNYDGEFKGSMSLMKALEQSRNLPAVLVTARIGPKSVIKYARKLGIESPLPRNLTIALGSADINVLELVRAYGVICCEGVYAPTRFIKRVLTSDGKVIYDSNQSLIDNLKEVVSPQSAFILTQVMTGVAKRGTATILKDFPVAVAGKTGTTNNFEDAWFIGCTPNFTTGIWIGFDQKISLGEKMTGGKVSAPVWKHYMLSVYERIKADPSKFSFPLEENFSPPEGVVKVYVAGSDISLEPIKGALETYLKESDVAKFLKSKETPAENISSYFEDFDF